jgi:small-conductance mechanosensitive channel
MDNIVAWLTRNGVSLAAIAGTLALLCGAGFAISALAGVLRRAIPPLAARLHLDDKTGPRLIRVVSGCLWVMVMLLILNIWGIGIGGVWTFLASAVAVVGVGFLAVWAMVSNVTAAFFLTLWRPFQLGQTVEILPEALRGRVIDRNMMFTVLQEDAGGMLHVPNNLFFQRIFRVTTAGLQPAPAPLEGAAAPARAGDARG